MENISASASPLIAVPRSRRRPRLGASTPGAPTPTRPAHTDTDQHREAVASPGHAARPGLFASLNIDQHRAATLGINVGGTGTGAGVGIGGPLLVHAGAGTGKTATLAARVAALLQHGVAPDRILLLTFSRRAAAEMISRAGRMLASVRSAHGQADLAVAAPLRLPWAGTFHSVAARLLRFYASSLGLNPSFSIIDQADASDLLDWLRTQSKLEKSSKRFPRAATCLKIYSDRVSTGDDLPTVLGQRFPWCLAWEAELKALFRAYVAEKQRQALLDYDDLLLWLSEGLADQSFASTVADRFDAILVDEFQDSNGLQHTMLSRLAPGGQGVFVVGDDAQSIYGFRGACVEHIRQFAAGFTPPAATVALTINYRSTQSILDTANALMADDPQAMPRRLLAAHGRSGGLPALATVLDDAAQNAYVIDSVLANREAGISLKDQAVLFRTASHSDTLELALARADIPFVKHGGLKFVEAAHVKDVLAMLRWARNPQNRLAGLRALQMLPGFGPARARDCLQRLLAQPVSVQPESVQPESVQPEWSALADYPIPREAAEHWAQTITLLAELQTQASPWRVQLDLLLAWARPLLTARYDNPDCRLADLDILCQIALDAGSADAFLADFALDPPQAAGDYSDKAHRDEDFLILSTVHSAKGQEWHSVYILNVADGSFPNEYSCDSDRALAEERRLLYVAMTRARESLHLIEPQRYYVTHQPRLAGAYVTGARSRFLSPQVLATLAPAVPLALSTSSVRAPDHAALLSEAHNHAPLPARQNDLAQQLRDMW